jgi:ankyrin repeat protein
LGPGFTPLHWAAGEWPTELTGFTTGILAEDNEWSPLGGLRGQAKLDFVKVLLAHGANPNVLAKATPRYGDGPGESAANAVGATPFLMAARAGDAAVMRVLAAAGADPRATTPQKATAVMLAANLGGSVDYWLPESSYLDAVRLALELGVNVNAANTAGDTALHVAALRGSATFVQVLIDHGANVNVKNKYGWTPLTVAEGVSTNGYAKSPATAEVLLKAGAIPTPPGQERNAQRISPPPPA